MHPLHFILIFSFCALLLTSCKTLPAIPLTTPEPLKVDLTMRLDVYQYRGEEPGDKAEVITISEANERLRNRMAEIQELKNNRIVGEDHRGLLSLRQTPAGDWGDYVKRTVEEENTDRTLLARHEAKESNRPLQAVQTENWRLRTEHAFKGEWIEVPAKTPGTFEWKQATGKPEKTAAAPVKVEAKTVPKP